MGGRLRIIGGQFRSRLIELPGGRDVRPMTDRAREALFNMIGTEVEGRHVLDLFAGSGALGIEALSRGARHAWFIELERAVADCLRRNLRQLGLTDRSTVYVADAYRWVLRRAPSLPAEPVLVFVAPPYSHFTTKLAELQKLLSTLSEVLAPESLLVVQAPPQFDPGTLPGQFTWDARVYGQVQVAIGEKTGEASSK